MTSKEQGHALARVEQMRNLLAFLLVGAFISVLPFLLFRVIPTENKETFVYMVGQLSGMATMALGFYFVNKVGQDAVDAKRADNTGKLADAVVAAANANKTPAAPEKSLDEMTLDELTAVAIREGVTMPDPVEEAALRLAIAAKRDASATQGA